MRRRAILATLLIAAFAAGTARATPPLGNRAVEAGYPARDCGYCHTFDIAHMREQARKMGVNNMNCQTCHGSKLPKQGAALFNARGQFLMAEKIKRKASEVDVRWLAGYVEPSPRTKAARP